MEVKPIPAYYVCYLLRSTVRHSSVYVGSTPNPLRRLGQHNGKAQGGAVRTSRLSLRPWEMACVVANFPSNIAALQFEWAWQNPHLTRFIAPDDRISFATTRSKTSKTGGMRRRPGRPRTSLTEKLSNLHLLLRAAYFSKWPLEIKFFCEDVFRVWQTWCDRVDGRLPSHIKVQLDLKEGQMSDASPSAQPPTKRRKADPIRRGGVEGIDPTYASLQDVLEKGQFVFDQDEQLNCDVCHRPLELNHDLITICPHETCRSTSHVPCLAKKFLPGRLEDLLPIKGRCPSCHEEFDWVVLMKELSLRVRGDKEVQKVLKKKRLGKVTHEALETEEDDDEAEDSDDELDMITCKEADDEDDGMSVTSYASETSAVLATSRVVEATGRLDAVIEDSDDDVEILNV